MLLSLKYRAHLKVICSVLRGAGAGKLVDSLRQSARSDVHHPNNVPFGAFKACKPHRNQSGKIAITFMYTNFAKSHSLCFANLSVPQKSALRKSILCFVYNFNNTKSAI